MLITAENCLVCPLREAAVSPAGAKPSTADVSFPFQTHPLGSCFLPLLWERRDFGLPLSPPPPSLAEQQGRVPE